MTLGVKRSGEALRAAAGDLAHVWRAARFASGAPVFPGLLDGVMQEFLERVAEGLLLGLPPGEAWPSTRGVVRLPASNGAAVLAEEWRTARDVLLSACEALEVSGEAAEAVQKEIDAAARAIEPLLSGHGPAGVLVLRQLAGFRPRGGGGPRNGAPR
jgi:hypothetical protein